MGLLDRWPQGRHGVVLALAVGLVAALLGSAAAILAWGDGTGDGPASASPSRPADPPVRVVSRAGGFAVLAPGALVGDRVGRGVKLATKAGDVVVTVGPTGEAGLAAGHRSALDAIRSTYPEVRVDRTVRTRLGSLPARRSVGAVRRLRDDQLIFSVTTGAEGRRTWSVVMFAARDAEAARLERYYQPVLDGFHLLR